MKNAFLIIPVLLGIISCSQPQGEKTVVKKAPQTVSADSSVADSTLFNLREVRRFSDSTQMDTLRLKVTGDDLMRGNAQLTITRFDGQVIYQQFFPVQKLLGSQVIPMDRKQRTLSDTERNGILTTRLNAFFDDKNFLVPAVSSTEKIVERGIVDKEFWERLKLEPASVGFVYTFGDDNHFWIAYDRQSGEVRVYYNCC